MQDYFNELWIGFVQTIPRIVLALLVAAIAFWADDRLQRAVERAVGARRGQRELARLLGRLVRIAVLFVGLIVILSIFDQSGLLASFIASLGITGLLIAFALQDITKNFAAGVLLLIQRPFNLGDRIRVGPNEGVVTDVTLRATILRTIDGHEVIIPNADVFTAAIINFTRYPHRRYAVPLALPLDVDIEAASRALVQALRQVPGTQAEPPPTVVSTAVGKDEQQLEARFWVASAAEDWQAIVSEATRVLQQEVQALRAPQPEASPVDPA